MDRSQCKNKFENKNINFLLTNEKNFRELFSFLQRKNYKPSSLSRKLSSLKQFYDVLKSEGYININPLNNLESFKKIKNIMKVSDYQITIMNNVHYIVNNKNTGQKHP